MKKWHVIVITALAVLLAGALLADRWERPYHLAKERKAARAAGIPLTPADFHRHKPASGQDAAQDWLALAEVLKRRPAPENAAMAVELVPPGVLPTATQLTAYLDGRGDVARRIRRITDRRGAYFAHTWKVDETFPYLITMREASRFLGAEALLLAHRGDFEAAVREQARGFRIADHAAMDPLPVSFLVSATIEDETLEGLERILRLAGPDARTAAAVLRAIDDHPSRRDLALMVRGAALFDVSIIRAIRSVEQYRDFVTPIPLVAITPPPPPAPPRRIPPNALVIRYVAEPGEAAYLRRVTPYVVAARGTMPTADFDRLDRRPTAARPFAFGDLVAGLAAPLFQKMPEREMQTAAHRSVVRAAAFVMAYRARYGAYPARLTDATKRPPQDPNTGKPVRYRRETGGFVVESAGNRPGPRGGRPIDFRYPAPTVTAKERPL